MLNARLGVGTTFLIFIWGFDPLTSEKADIEAEKSLQLAFAHANSLNSELYAAHREIIASRYL